MMRNLRSAIIGCCCALVISAANPTLAADASAPASAPASHKSHEKAATGVVSLDVYGEGQSRLHLLTAERAAPGEKPMLAYTRSEDGGATWTARVPVGEGQPSPDPVKRGNDAQIVAAGDHLVAAWTTGADNKMGRGPLATAVSHDGGKTWKPGPSPSDARGVVDHAFTDLAADEAGGFHAVWLDNRPSSPPPVIDGRKLVASDQLPVAGGSTARPDTPAGPAPVASDSDSRAEAPTVVRAHSPAKALRYARSTNGGNSWSANLTLDAACCECCWNSVLTLPSGKVCVLYRDKDPRDMALIQSADAGQTWGKPVTVGAFNWGFTGCPHVGGAITAGGEQGRDLCAVVWTAKGGDEVGVFALSSTDGGKTWSSPAPLGGPQSSRPDVAGSADGSRLLAVWDAFVDAGPDVGNAAFTSSSSDGGKTWSPPVRVSESGKSVTYPRVVRVPDGFRVFWTEQAGGGKPVKWVSRVVE